jgi:hypothetical protein
MGNREFLDFLYDGFQDFIVEKLACDTFSQTIQNYKNLAF